MTMIDKDARAERRRQQEEGARRLRESGVLDDLFESSRVWWRV